jgi:hypothetical protein
MTWFFLTLSLAFFCARNFRPVLEAPLAMLLPTYWSSDYDAAAFAIQTSEDLDNRTWQVGLLKLGTGRILERFFSLRRYATPEQLRQMARDAERSGDTTTMAFAALHLPDPEMRDDILDITDHAIATDPRMTWLIICVVNRISWNLKSAAVVEGLKARLQKLEAWDPGNSAPHLLHALLQKQEADLGKNGKQATAPDLAKDLNNQLEWQKQMETAFALPKYDSYSLQRFEVERHFLITQGWDNPLVVVLTLNFNSPGLNSAHDYAKLVVNEMGKSAETAGRTDDALRDYRIAARFGERLRTQGVTVIDDLMGMSIQRLAYASLIPALKKAGKPDEAAAVEFAQKEFSSELDRRFSSPRERSSYRAWSVLLAGVAASAVWVFLFLSVISIIYVNAKAWIRREKKGSIFRIMTTLENYAPIVLFLSSLVLALVYAPFAENFSTYMALKTSLTSWEQLGQNSFPTNLILNRTDLPLQNPYHGLIIGALAIAALVMVISFAGHRLARLLKPA